MIEYIDRSTARAEITLAYEDGRIGTLEDILGVLDLIPAAEVDRGKENTATGGKPYARLTTDQPEDNVSQSLNLFYAKDGETWCRNCGPGPEYADIKLADFIRLAAKAMFITDLQLQVSDRAMDELTADLLAHDQDGPYSILAIIHTAGWAFAKLREKLKLYEDTGLTPEEVAALKVGQAGAGARDEAKGEADQDSEDAVLYAVVKDGSEAVNVSADVHGSVDSALVGLTVLISDVAQLMGSDFVALCIALAANPPAWLAGRDHQ